MPETLYTWHVYHPDNWRPSEISGRDYTEPPVNEDHEYLIDTEDVEGRFDGYLIGTLTDEIPAISQYWGSRGWLIKRQGEWRKIDADYRAEDIDTIEVHNVYTVYGLNKDGSEIGQSLATYSRPQDWGDPRWHFERFEFRWFKDKCYINHAYCWTDLKLEQHEYLQLFAPLLVQILMPGKNEKLCGRQYLDDDDFWFEEWGPMPPHFNEEEEEDF